MPTIAVDAMGGDFAPGAVVEGVVQALHEMPEDVRLLVVGDETVVRENLERSGAATSSRIELVHAPDRVEMGEPARAALRNKKNSSISVAVSLVKEGRADAVVSAGHTGAAVVASVVRLRTLPGIERPGIATVIPSPAGPWVLVDAGANVDAKPEHLVQYAVMGEVYARDILHFDSPRIGLLSVGGEDGKGNALTRETFRLLESLKSVRFVGNVEGNDLFKGAADVVVCDGFVGNVVLKLGEGLAVALGGFLKQLLRKNPIRRLGALLCYGAFRDFREWSDSAEYGGAPLLGVNGVCIIGHGASTGPAVKNAIRVACEFVDLHVNRHIVERLQEVGLTAGGSLSGGEE